MFTLNSPKFNRVSSVMSMQLNWVVPYTYWSQKIRFYCIILTWIHIVCHSQL